MPRRCYEQDSSSGKEPPRKKSSSGIANSIQFKQGEIVTDLCSKKWRIGKPIGIGGFGEIYEATDILTRDVKTDSSFVAKIEKHSSGPLFVEVNFYLRIAKSQMIEEWKKANHMKFLGMPHYVASGSHYCNGEKYRFLMLPKYKRDLDNVLKEKKLFNIKTVSIIAIQILDVLQYIHSKGYVHSDIKASNIMLGTATETVRSRTRQTTRKTNKSEYKLAKPSKTRKVSVRNLRQMEAVNYIDDIPFLDEVLERHEKKRYRTTLGESLPVKKNDNVESDRVYLLDYGLASKYLLSNGEHKEFCTDERRAHAGTVLFCSRDAHKGVPSRRSDLESLAYNLVYWLTGSLPWIENLDQPLDVEKKKIRCFGNLKSFLELSFNSDFPNFVLEYFEYLNGLQYKENPDYDLCRKIFKKAMKTYGYKDDSVLDFDNQQGWGIKKKKQVIPRNNRIVTSGSFLKTSPLMPLHSNIVFHRPKLRKKTKNNNNNVKVQDTMMNWSKILTDPETIIKQGRERKTTDGSDQGGMSNLSSLDIESLNPTYAMLEVYNRCKDRESSPRYKESYVPENIEGYTPAMMSIYAKMLEKKELESASDSNSQSDYEISFKIAAKKKKRTPRRKGSESPTVQRTIRAKAQANNVTRKKEILHQLQLKKAKSSPVRRTYSLRG